MFVKLMFPVERSCIDYSSASTVLSTNNRLCGILFSSMLMWKRSAARRSVPARIFEGAVKNTSLRRTTRNYFQGFNSSAANRKIPRTSRIHHQPGSISRIDIAGPSTRRVMMVASSSKVSSWTSSVILQATR